MTPGQGGPALLSRFIREAKAERVDCYTSFTDIFDFKWVFPVRARYTFDSEVEESDTSDIMDGSPLRKMIYDSSISGVGTKCEADSGDKMEEFNQH